ncbi:secretin N-terminal domain-containing protein [Dechloromonas sp. HYN0024]|uniref:secretin N-terminal domain-containing protein n=1 Tax=Dechloromonas sp. HYN0024 TaxID=2231055 RepID=UPI0013C2F7AB|nr:secretin N-terminal domain-containing protein [Dechloromonas sp. HYN0024]
MIAKQYRPLLLALLVSTLLAACSSNPAFDEGRRLLAEGKQEQGVELLAKALRDKPDDPEVRSQYYRQREILSGRQLSVAESTRAAGRLDEAETLFRQVLKTDSDNVRANGGLAEISAARRRQGVVRDAETLLKKSDSVAAENLLRIVLTEDPNQSEARASLKRIRDDEANARSTAQGINGPFAKPITLEFRDTPLRAAFEVMSRTAGLNFVLDKDVKADVKITLFVRNVSIEDALRLILVTNQLDRKLLNDNSVLIYPNIPAKLKEYQETVVKTFYLANADVKQAQALIKSMIKSKDVFIDEKLNLLIVKDTPDAIKLAEKLIESLDLALPEVMLEVEVLEVSRNRLLNLGLQFPDHVSYGKLTPDSTTASSNGTLLVNSTAFGGALAPGNIDLARATGLTSFVLNPGITLNLKKQDGDSRLLANPRIRVINREKAKIHIGDKLPVFTTTSTANVGVAASVSYLDVGLKLEVEPTVHLDENVEMKVGLEVSSIVKEVAGPSNSLAYQIGTRSANTVLRLRDGETQILAGLINDEERSSANRIPGLGDMPVVGRLFSSQSDSKNKTEIVLLITPRVIRNVVRPEASAPAIVSGTEMAVGVAPFTIRAGGLRGISSGGASRQNEILAVEPAVADAPLAEVQQVAPPSVEAVPAPAAGK